MNAVYQMTALLVISLIATTITIFVLGVSLLGRALGRAAEDKKKTEEMKKADAAVKLAKLRATLDEPHGAMGRGNTAELKRQIAAIEKQQEKFTGEIRRIEETPSLLKVGGCVVEPSCFLILSLGLTIVSLALDSSTQLVPNSCVKPIPWFLGLVLMAMAIRRVYLALTTIQEIALVSDEVSLHATITAMTTALAKHDESKKPELSIVFQQPFPLNLSTGAEMTINCALGLVKGAVAEKASVLFMTPPNGLVFIGGHTFTQPSRRCNHPGYPTVEFRVDEVKAGLAMDLDLRIKAPGRPGTYEMVYVIYCRGFNSGDKTFTVIVQ